MKCDLSSQEKKTAKMEGFQNKALRRLFAPKGKEEKGEQRKPHNEKFILVVSMKYY
jgi:hypothetical protein